MLGPKGFELPTTDQTVGASTDHGVESPSKEDFERERENALKRLESALKQVE